MHSTSLGDKGMGAATAALRVWDDAGAEFYWVVLCIRAALAAVPGHTGRPADESARCDGSRLGRS